LAGIGYGGEQLLVAIGVIGGKTPTGAGAVGIGLLFVLGFGVVLAVGYVLVAKLRRERSR
jgi:hypothetical protein